MRGGHRGPLTAALDVLEAEGRVHHPDRLIGKLVPELCAWADGLTSQGLCTRLCLDTYERELERYGGPAGMRRAVKYM